MLREEIEKELTKEKEIVAAAIKGTGYEVWYGGSVDYRCDGEIAISFSVRKMVAAVKKQGGGE